MKKKLIIISIVIVALAIAGGSTYFFYFKNKGTTYLWRVAKVEKGDVVVTVTATGSINALTTVQVGTQVSGTISKLLVDFNSVVKEGQVIAILDTKFLEAAKEDAEANLDKATTTLAQAKREYDRTKSLFDKKVLAQADYDLALTGYETAQSSLKSAKSQLNRAVINLQYATIKAPISGTVISRNVDVGQTVISSFNAPTLFTIANDLTKMQVQANIDEADIGEIKVGQTVSFNVDAYPDETFKGLVKQIRLQPTVVQNVVNYTVIIDVSNDDLKLMPGLTANIYVKIKEHRNVLKVPMNALHFIPPADYLTSGKGITDSLKLKWSKMATTGTRSVNKNDSATYNFVWIQKDKIIVPVLARIGISDGTFTEISGDLKEGDEIVTGINREDAGSASPTATNPFMPKMPTRRRTM